MTEIRFYHLTRGGVKNALPAILTKALERGMRAHVLVSDDKQAADIDDYLWSFDPGSFLPHAKDGDENPADHPIWISTQDINVNKADLLIITDALPYGDISNFSMCCEVFNGHHDETVTLARAKWKAYQKEGHSITYWQQNDNGAWQKKA